MINVFNDMRKVHHSFYFPFSMDKKYASRNKYSNELIENKVSNEITIEKNKLIKLENSHKMI